MFRKTKRSLEEEKIKLTKLFIVHYELTVSQSLNDVFSLPSASSSLRLRALRALKGKKAIVFSYERSQHVPTVLSNESCDEWWMSGAILGSTIEEAGKSLYQPITILVKSNSSNKIRAIPMKHLRSIRP